MVSVSADRHGADLLESSITYSRSVHSRTRTLDRTPARGGADARELGLPLGARNEDPGSRRPTGARSHNGCPECSAARRDSRRPRSVGRSPSCSWTSGSLAIAEQLDPEDLRAAMLDFQRACADAIERYGADRTASCRRGRRHTRPGHHPAPFRPCCEGEAATRPSTASSSPAES